MRQLFVLLAVISLLVVSGGDAYGTKPGPGTSTGSGRVFFPNPVAQLQDQTLTDQKDADYAALQPAYRVQTLTNLDGSGFLRGEWAVIVSETGNPAYSPTNSFIYNRTQDEFEQVMAYYWITEAQKYIQRLGFGSTLRAINKEPQRIRINQWGADNSFATTHKDELRFGKGGVDDAEDAEVILHEYGHAIHPVAGRMPGHMNVLLAEANVPYEKLFDMEQINEDFQRADVALVIGANDVTNPAARKDTSSPIYGMPILNVDQAQNIIVIKRSMKPGFAGIDNELYLDPKTGMLFGDAKEAVARVVSELKKS